MTGHPREPWHLDRRVPIATLAVLVVQIAIGVMWITTLSNKVTRNSEVIVSVQADAQAREVRIRAVEIAQASQSSDLRAIQGGIARIEAQLEKLQPKP